MSKEGSFQSIDTEAISTKSLGRCVAYAIWWEEVGGDLHYQSISDMCTAHVCAGGCERNGENLNE